MKLGRGVGETVGGEKERRGEDWVGEHKDEGEIIWRTGVKREITQAQ